MDDAGEGERVPHAGDFGFEDWNWGFDSNLDSTIEDVIRDAMDSVAAQVADKVEELISKQVAEVIIAEFDETPPRMGLPIIWGGDTDGHTSADEPPHPIDNPLTLYVTVPGVGANTVEGPVWKWSFQDFIISELSLHAEGGMNEEGPLSEEGKEVAAKVSAALRELADRVDAYARR